MILCISIKWKEFGWHSQAHDHQTSDPRDAAKAQIADIVRREEAIVNCIRLHLLVSALLVLPANALAKIYVDRVGPPRTIADFVKASGVVVRWSRTDHTASTEPRRGISL
jgi:hypothetical protein